MRVTIVLVALFGAFAFATEHGEHSKKPKSFKEHKQEYKRKTCGGDAECEGYLKECYTAIKSVLPDERDLLIKKGAKAVEAFKTCKATYNLGDLHNEFRKKENINVNQKKAQSLKQKVQNYFSFRQFLATDYPNSDKNLRCCMLTNILGEKNFGLDHNNQYKLSQTFLETKLETKITGEEGGFFAKYTDSCMADETVNTALLDCKKGKLAACLMDGCIAEKKKKVAV